MLETLKKHAMQSYLMRIAISAIILIAILAITKFAIFQVLTGGTELDVTADPSSYEGKYVTVDVEYFLADYVEHTTTTTNRNTNSSSTKVNGDSYIVFNAVDDYEKGSSVWYFYSAYAPRNRLEELYQKMDEAWEYLADETYTVVPPEPVTIKGSWVEMTGEQRQYYEETLEEIGIEATEFDIIHYYAVDSATIGGMNTGSFWVCMIVALAALIFLIYTLIGMCTASYKKRVTKFLQENTSLSMGTIDTDFASARKIGKKLWIGKRFTIWVDGYNIQIVDNANLVWGYYYRRTGRNSVSQMRLYDTLRNMKTVGLTKEHTEEALEYYGQILPQMVIGYTSDLEKIYNKQFDEFLNIKYKPAQAAAQDPFFGSSAYNPSYESSDTAAK